MNDDSDSGDTGSIDNPVAGDRRDEEEMMVKKRRYTITHGDEHVCATLTLDRTRVIKDLHVVHGTIVSDYPGWHWFYQSGRSKFAKPVDKCPYCGAML